MPYKPKKPKPRPKPKRLCAAFFLLTPLAAQEVRVVNFGPAVWDGYVRATVDVPVQERGVLPDGTRYWAGRYFGSDMRVVDLHCRVPAYTERAFDLSTAQPLQWTADSNALEGIASPRINGQPLALAATSIGGKPNPLPDGAGHLIHWIGRPLSDKRLNVDLWVTRYPDQPWSVGEVIVTCSNADLDGWQLDITEDIVLDWPEGLVLIDALGLGQPLLRAGDHLFDGQSRAYRFVVAWAQGLTPTKAHSALLNAEHAIVANGIQTPSYLGQVAPSTQDQRPWVIQHWQGARDRLHTWDAGPLGGAARSGRTGAQEDQGFAKGSRAYAPGGIGTEAIRYYVAMGSARRPCNHLEANGDRLRLDRPGLVFWDGRPHYNAGVSPDQLGQTTPRPYGDWRWHGWSGPDRQHWFVNTLAFAAEVTGSPACQWLLEKHAVIWHYQETVDPRLSTSSPGAARSQGWAGIIAAQLWHTLEDRTLALSVAERWRDRVLQIYVPHWERVSLWDRQQDPRVTQYVDTEVYPYVSMVYQSAFGTMGVTLGLQAFPSHVAGIARARRMAYDQAMLVMSHAYDSELNGWEIVGVLPDGRTLASELVEGYSAHRTGWFERAWLPGCAWTVLQTDPDNATAKSIYEIATAGSAPNDWMPPLK